MTGGSGVSARKENNGSLQVCDRWGRGASGREARNGLLGEWLTGGDGLSAGEGRARLDGLGRWAGSHVFFLF